MRKLGVGGVALIAAAWAAGGATAQGATFPSEVIVSGIGQGDGLAFGDGHVDSSRSGCLSNREVKIFALTDDGPVLVSTDRSSDNGFWGGHGPATDVNGVRAVMKPKRLGPGKRCSGDIGESLFPPRTMGAAPRRTTFATDVDLGSSSIGDSPFVTGTVTARRACRANRKIRISVLIDKAPVKLIDTDRASDNGYFGGGGSAPGANGVRASAPIKRLGPSRRCAAGSDETIINLAAGAEARTVKSTVDLTGASFGPEIVGANGNIVSKRSRCLSNRVVQITAIFGDERLHVSTDVSSLNGYWGGQAAGNGPDGFRARMKPKRISKRKKCSGDRDSLFLRPTGQERATFPGTLQYYQLAYAGDQVGGAGNIVSVRRCFARREVKVFDFDDGERGAFRAGDVSSRNGWWGALAPSSSQGVRLTLVKKRLGPGKVCEGDVYSYDPDPNP